MFSKLKNKLKSWTKKVSESSEEIEEVVEKQEVQETSKKEAKEKKKESKPKKVEAKNSKKKKEKTKTLKEESEDINKNESMESGRDESPKEEVKEEPQEAEVEKKSLFSKISSKVSKTIIKEEDFDEYSEDLEMLLLENNVALEVAEKVTQELKEKIVGQEMPKKEIENKIKQALKEIIEDILIDPFDLVKKIEEKKGPYVILFCGINGTGKTTTIAKFANLLKKEKLSCVMAAADTFRAAAIDQIKKHGDALDIKVISHDYNSDPAAVGFDAVKYAQKNSIDAVLIDTAGRIHTDKNLMAQITKIAKVTNPDTKIFVGESLTGNDSVEQVKAFDEAIALNGIILTKADIDEKGGTALSVGYVTEKPILYLGIGQEYNKIEKFDKQKFIEKLEL